MNKQRRALLQRAKSALETAEGLVDQALWEEQDCLSNMPENLESTERYEKMENAIELMEEALENIRGAAENLDSAAE